jgi:hypothetical protein
MNREGEGLMCRTCGRCCSHSLMRNWRRIRFRHQSTHRSLMLNRVVRPLKVSSEGWGRVNRCQTTAAAGPPGGSQTGRLDLRPGREILWPHTTRTHLEQGQEAKQHLGVLVQSGRPATIRSHLTAS